MRGMGDLIYRQRRRKLVLQYKILQLVIFLKIISLGPHLAKQYVSMVTALASVPVCNSGPTELLLIGLDILKITNPKPVTKLYGNCKADATKLC